MIFKKNFAQMPNSVVILLLSGNLHKTDDRVIFEIFLVLTQFSACGNCVLLQKAFLIILFQENM